MLSAGGVLTGKRQSIDVRRESLANEALLDMGMSPLKEKKTFWQKMARFMKIALPHVGLVLLVAMYVICGGAIFHLIELSHEEKVRSSSLKTIAERKQRFLTDTWNLSRYNGITERDWLSFASSEILSLEAVLYEAYDDQYITMNDILNKSHRTIWSFPQAIFFATTVITNIGYGNMVPRTVSGRVLCIVYSLFGIPLLWITIADIGKFLSDLITFLYGQYKICKHKLRQRSTLLSFQKKTGDNSVDETKSESEISSQTTDVRLPVFMAMVVLVSYTAVGGLLFQAWEGWAYFDAFYFCFITMATIGFGDIVPTEQMYLLFTIIYIVVGLALTTMCIDLAGSEYITKLHYFGHKIETASDVFGGAVVSGLHAGEQIFKHNAFIRTSGGKLIEIGSPQTLNKKHASFLRHKFGLPEDYDFTIVSANSGEPQVETNSMLFAPVNPEVLRIVKRGLKLRPDEISESDAFVLQNRIYSLTNPTKSRRHRGGANYQLASYKPKRKMPLRQDRYSYYLLAPFVLNESPV